MSHSDNAWLSQPIVAPDEPEPEDQGGTDASELLRTPPNSGPRSRRRQIVLPGDYIIEVANFMPGTTRG